MESGLIVRESAPYSSSDAVDYAISYHAEPQGIPCVELEIHQDLIRDPVGESTWSRGVSSALAEAKEVFFRLFPLAGL